jgi:hypothetical protein
LNQAIPFKSALPEVLTNHHLTANWLSLQGLQEQTWNAIALYGFTVNGPGEPVVNPVVAGSANGDGLSLDYRLAADLA